MPREYIFDDIWSWQLVQGVSLFATVWSKPNQSMRFLFLLQVQGKKEMIAVCIVSWRNSVQVYLFHLVYEC